MRTLKRIAIVTIFACAAIYLTVFGHMSLVPVILFIVLFGIWFFRAVIRVVRHFFKEWNVSVPDEADNRERPAGFDIAGGSISSPSPKSVPEPGSDPPGSSPTPGPA